MVNHLWGLAAAALLASALSPARAADLLAAVDPGVVDEVLPAPRVTAEAVIVGLVLQKATAEPGAAARSVLAAIPPAARAGGVCLRVVTSDGLYQGRVAYDPVGPGAEPVALLPYETSTAQVFAYAEPDVAALAFPCAPGGALTRIGVATWAADDAAPLSGTAELLINSFRADQAFVALGDGPQFDCVKLTDGSRAAFDFRCAIPVDLLAEGAALTLFRARGASLDPEITVDVIGWK